jgi:hypothetical protein
VTTRRFHPPVTVDVPDVDAATDFYNIDDILHPRPPVIVLCGSTRFADQIDAAARDLLLSGHPVLTSPAIPGLSEAGKAALDQVHRRYIELCDEVLVVCPGGYMGESVRAEVAYAELLGRPVRYIDPAVAVPA